MTRLQVAHSTTSRLVTALNSFGLRLLQEESARSQEQNLFLSPVSIFLALAMAENGSAGKTRAAIRQALALSPQENEEAVNASISMLLESLRARIVELSIANALWTDIRTPLAPDFVRRCKDVFDAEANELDLSQPSAAEIINRWISEKTKAKIPAIADPENLRGAIALLTNAAYFKGKFRHQFVKAATEKGTFHFVDGRKKQVPMMWRTFPPESYFRGKICEVAVLPYENSGIALYVLLPAKGTTPEKVVSAASVENLERPQEHFDLHVIMPRFTLDFRSSLNQSLERMGMGIAFQPGADFTPMGSSLLFIGDVLHKARLVLDEEGTIATAATVVMEAAGLPSNHLDVMTLVFDRPFALLLRDTVSGAILFAGIVYDPNVVDSPSGGRRACEK
jgi:serine protease inhibitor